MTTFAGFEPITEVSADGRGRIAVGRALTGHESERFAVARNAEGQILLTPLASIPRRELLIWEDEQTRASLQRGMLDAAEGRVRRRDDFLDAAEDEEE